MSEKVRFRKFVCVFFLLFLIILLIASSQENKYTPESQRSLFVLQRINGQVSLDGSIDEEAWKDITLLPMTMILPNYGNPPSEKTEVLIAYDDDYLYVAARLYDKEPSKILASSKKRDYMGANTEWFGILLDTFNDKENGLSFYTTPSGLRFDAVVFNDGEPRTPTDMPLSLSWNTFWDVETEQNNQGWFAEMRIPFSSLRFQDKDGRVVMGLIVCRWIARKNEMDVFPAIYPKWGGMSTWKCSQAQEVLLEGVQSRNPLYVTPYLLSGYGQGYELNEEETSYLQSEEPTLEAGLDVKYGLTSNLTLDVTLNTDFAQVEADDEQVNLTRFSLFFPEKRLFFQERSAIFDFNLGGSNQLFYSRQIGIYEEEMVRIYGGVRLVGRLGPWDLGFLDMQTAPIQDLPSENFGVIRLRRRVFNPFSYLGGIITTRIGTDGSYNAAYGLDGIFRLFEDSYLSFNWVQTFENGKENNPLSLDPAKFRISWERRTLKGLGLNLDYSRAGVDFNPAMGFEIRENYSRFGNRILYGWMPGEKSSLQNHYIFADGFWVLRNDDSLTESLEFGPGWGFSSRSGWFGEFALKAYRENILESFDFLEEVEVPPGDYSFYGVKGQLQTPQGKPLSAMISVDSGTFYDGWRVSLGVMPFWGISSDISMIGFYQFNRVEFPDRGQKLTAHIARLQFLATLSTKFSASAFIQYNGVIDAVIANIRVRYNPREGNDLYIVYNDVLNTNRWAEVPTLPFSSNRAIMVKYSYTFNFKK